MKSKENKTTKTKGLGYLYLSNSPNNKKKTIGTKYKTFFLNKPGSQKPTIFPVDPTLIFDITKAKLL